MPPREVPEGASATDRAVRPSAPAVSRPTWLSSLREIGAGATVGIISLPFCVSAGVLAFEPFGPDYTAAGAGTGILCAVAGGLAAALARSSSFVISVPSAPMALIQASFASGILASVGGDVATAMALMPLCVILAGLWQGLFAWSGLARAVKFTPYPVLAGFVTGLAVLTAEQQVPRLFGEASLGGLVATLARGEWPSPGLALLGLAIVALIRISERIAPRLPGMLAGLVVGTAAWHGLALLRPDLDLGRTIGAFSLGPSSFGPSFAPGALLRLLSDLKTVQSILLTSLTLAILGVLDFTFSLRAAQNLCDVPFDSRRDLAAQGFANTVAGLAGGMAVTTSIGLSTTSFEAGGRTRLSSIAYALVLLLTVSVAPSLIAALPLVVLAAILLSIAWRLWDRWCLALLREAARGTAPAARLRARRNLAIVAAVMATTVVGQPVVGAVVGVMLSCLVFIAEMSRPVVRRRRGGDRLVSKRIRSQGDRAVLAEAGRRTLVLDLQGVLFFGNADDLATEIKRVEGSVDTVILDLRRVSDLDTSGANVLRQIAERCRESRIRLMVAGADPTYRDLLQDGLPDGLEATLYSDIDVALEDEEDRLLAAHGARSARRALRIDETDLAAGLSEAELARLVRRLAACTYTAGTFLCRAGEPADKLWLLTRGSVSVRVAGARRSRRIAGLGPGTAVGEMGLIDRRPRSADVVADEDVEAYLLAAEDFDALLREEPHLGQSILATIARLTAQRLRATSDELRLAEL